MATRRSRVGAFGHFILSAFASSGPPAFPPPDVDDGEFLDPVDDEGKLLSVRNKGMPSVLCLNEEIVRPSTADPTDQRFGHRAMRKLRSSASLRSLRSTGSIRSLRERFSKGGKLQSADVAEIEEEPDEEFYSPTPSRATPALRGGPAVRHVVSPSEASTTTTHSSS
jgi:hypothetical protein